MSLPPVFRRVLKAGSEESAKTPPTGVDLLFRSRGLHGLRARGEDLYRHLAGQRVFRVTLQVDLPVADRKVFVVRAGEELRFAELQDQLGGLERAVAGCEHHDAHREVQVQAFGERGNNDVGLRPGHLVAAPVEIQGLHDEGRVRFVPRPDFGAGAPERDQVTHRLLFRDALQLVAAALDGLEELPEVVLQVREHLVRVVLGAEPDLTLAAAGVLHDLRAALLGSFKDLLLGGDLLGLVLGAAVDPVALAARLVEHRLALLDDPARLLELLWDGLAHLVNDVEGGVPVDHGRVAEAGEAPRFLHQLLQPVYQHQYVHPTNLSFAYNPYILPSEPEYISRTVSSMPSGTSPRMSPPKDAISRTALEERKLCSAEAIMKTVSSSGNIVRLSCACSNSDSKSETALRPLTMALAPCSRAKSTSRPSMSSTETFSMSAVIFSSSRARSTAGITGFLRRFAPTAITTWSKIFDARRMMSRCPAVTGSKLPGQTATIIVVSDRSSIVTYVPP